MPTKSIRLAILLASAAGGLSACATREEVAALRQPAMPPVAVAKASPARAFYRNVVVQDVVGAPEFRWFDGGAVVITRPTRVQVVESLNNHLRHAEMTAERMARWPADALFVVYCAGPHCNGADRAALKLARLGRPVKLMIGGITGWEDEGLPFANGEEPGALEA